MKRILSSMLVAASLMPAVQMHQQTRESLAKSNVQSEDTLIKKIGDNVNYASGQGSFMARVSYRNVPYNLAFDVMRQAKALGYQVTIDRAARSYDIQW